jgi:hypothetical protein
LPSARATAAAAVQTATSGVRCCHRCQAELESVRLAPRVVADCSRGSSAGERHIGRALWRSAVLCHGLGAVSSFENRRRFGSGYYGTPRI